MKLVGYARVSTREQNEARQLLALREFGAERITVALALLDENVESRSEAWFDFTEQRGQ